METVYNCNSVNYSMGKTNLFATCVIQEWVHYRVLSDYKYCPARTRHASVCFVKASVSSADNPQSSDRDKLAEAGQIESRETTMSTSAESDVAQSLSGMEIGGDPYRDHLSGEGEKHTAWRHGIAPRYELVNALFEKGQTQVWPKGSLEEVVQNLVKTWEMELSHKTRVSDFKSIHHEKFCISVNGGPKLSAAETVQVGSYNALMATTSFQGDDAKYQASKETFESSHEIFRTVFPGGFAWEVQAVYSPPPVVVMKYRHWGVMEGAYKGHAPTGEVVDSVGICIAKVDENLKIVELEVYYDTAAFLGGLTKNPKSESYGSYQKGVEGCPYLNHSRSQ